MNISTKPVILENFENYFYRRTLKSLCSYELKIYQARIDRLDTKMQRYFNSTPIRNAFARWMTYATYTSRFYTISELVKEMHSNRQTISTMINECEAEGYIVVKRQGSTVSCQATDLLVEKMEQYCEWRKELTQSTIGTAYNRLVQFEKLMQKRFA